MREKSIASWEDFEREIGGIFREYEERCRKFPSVPSHIILDNI